MKPFKTNCWAICYMSHPAWVRGLKLVSKGIPPCDTIVAPCVGAWIETHLLLSQHQLHFVAPCVGAWIETKLLPRTSQVASVAPCVGAWIETQHICLQVHSNPVAPCVGAWIETCGLRKIKSPNPKSHPAWVRGLKLRPQENGHHTDTRVAPCVGAWIET